MTPQSGFDQNKLSILDHAGWRATSFMTTLLVMDHVVPEFSFVPFDVAISLLAYYANKDTLERTVTKHTFNRLHEKIETGVGIVGMGLTIASVMTNAPDMRLAGTMLATGLGTKQIFQYLGRVIKGAQ